MRRADETVERVKQEVYMYRMSLMPGTAAKQQRNTERQSSTKRGKRTPVRRIPALLPGFNDNLMHRRDYAHHCYRNGACASLLECLS